MGTSESSSLAEDLHGLITISIADVAFLRDARDAILTHPKLNERPQESDAAACRLMMLVAVTAVDRVLEMWGDDPFLVAYTSKRTTNGERYLVLKRCIEQAGVTVDAATIEDYLAIKYLRNTLVHVKWKEDELEHIRARRFPTDPQDLGPEDWSRIIDVTDQLLRHLLGAGFLSRDVPGLNDPRLLNTGDVVDATSRRPRSLLSELLRPSDLPGLWWGNLERIHLWIRHGVLEEENANSACQLALESWTAFSRQPVSCMNERFLTVPCESSNFWNPEAYIRACPLVCHWTHCSTTLPRRRRYSKRHCRGLSCHH